MKKTKYLQIPFIEIWLNWFIHLICSLSILSIMFLNAKTLIEHILSGLLFIASIIISPFYLKFLKNRYK